jgi:site-specific DNA-methyltransferase (adenine-specific)
MIELYNADCLEKMKDIPDKSVDLVLTDPPYGLGDKLCKGAGKLNQTPMKVLYQKSDWCDIAPSKEFFCELVRISKNQIICGGNYFDLPPTRGFICWDKRQAMPTLSACEYIWTSFDCPAKIYSCSSTDLNRVHPTQKPVNLMKYLVDKFTNKGDTVLDPFMGSGTTGVACKLLNRNFIGIELSEEYFKIAQNRINQTEQGLF